MPQSMYKVFCHINTACHIEQILNIVEETRDNHFMPLFLLHQQK